MKKESSDSSVRQELIFCKPLSVKKNSIYTKICSDFIDDICLSRPILSCSHLNTWVYDSHEVIRRQVGAFGLILDTKECDQGREYRHQLSTPKEGERNDLDKQI